MVLLVRSLRPQQWTKNLFVFAGLLFSGHLLDRTAWPPAVAAFLIFCGLSGAVYLVNDIFDLSQIEGGGLEPHPGRGCGAGASAARSDELDSADLDRRADRRSLRGNRREITAAPEAAVQ